MLAMPSNLLAHHLHVLEQAGIIAEGNRRRTYLQLIPGALDSLAAPTTRAALRVLFVCTANSARSHLAAALWRQASDVPAASAGTHPAAAIDPGAVPHPEGHRLPLPRLRPRTISDVRHDGALHRVRPGSRGTRRGPGSALVHPDPVQAGNPGSFDAALVGSQPTAFGVWRRAWRPSPDSVACPQPGRGVAAATCRNRRAEAGHHFLSHPSHSTESRSHREPG